MFRNFLEMILNVEHVSMEIVVHRLLKCKLIQKVHRDEDVYWDWKKRVHFQSILWISLIWNEVTKEFPRILRLQRRKSREQIENLSTVPGAFSSERLRRCEWIDVNGKLVDTIDSGGIIVAGDSEVGVTGNGDASRRTGLLLVSDVGDDIWDFVCWSSVAEKKQIWYRKENSIEVRHTFTSGWWIWNLRYFSGLVFDGLFFRYSLQCHRGFFPLKNKFDKLMRNSRRIVLTWHQYLPKVLEFSLWMLTGEVSWDSLQSL